MILKNILSNTFDIDYIMHEHINDNEDDYYG
jgi:hypothetical protein